MEQGPGTESRRRQGPQQPGHGARAKARLDKAMTHWRKALEADPRLTEAHNNLGIALLGKRLEEGIAHFRKALDANAASAEVHDNLGMALLRKGQCGSAIAEFQKGLEIDPGFAAAHHNLGDTFLSSTREDPRT